MKFFSTASTALALVTSSGFRKASGFVSSSLSPPYDLQGSPKPYQFQHLEKCSDWSLMANKGDGLSEDPPGADDEAYLTEILGEIAQGDISSLVTRMLVGELDPNQRFDFGNTILHLLLVVIARNRDVVDEKVFESFVEALYFCGADLGAKNDNGVSVLSLTDTRYDPPLSKYGDILVKYINHKVEAPVTKEERDQYFAFYSLQQKLPHAIKQNVIELYKKGVSMDTMASNGKSVSDNIEKIWPKKVSDAFFKWVNALEEEKVKGESEKDKLYMAEMRFMRPF